MTDATTAPDVSVVIPCYNAERWVGRAIDSVLAQEGVTVEVIVIDDGSTDGSVDVLRRYEDRIHWETGPNRGACAARNRGLALACADYVMFLDADDYLLPACLSELRRQSALDDADAAIGSAYSEQVGGRRKKMKGPKVASNIDVLESWLTGKWVPPCAVLWTRDSISCLGAWDESLAKHQDTELMMRSAILGARFTHCRTANSIYFEGAGSERISQKNNERAHRDILRIRREIFSAIKGTNFDCHRVYLAIAEGLHKLEAKCLIQEQDQLAEEIKTFRKELGAPRYQGPLLHRIICTLVGLRTKTRISKAIQSWLSSATHVAK
jgi:glycosyltransferase involved in cell wall biosynthesis